MPIPEAKEYDHPTIPNGQKIFGFKLLKGDTFEEDDVYPMCNGEWNRVGKSFVEGQSVPRDPSVSFFFVRPKK